MARPTKRKTKHRGNAAGMVESRGDVRKGSGRPAGKGGRGPRDDDPRLREPTWRSAFVRALIAAAIFVVVVGVISRGAIVSVAVVGILLLGVYTPFGYYTDRFFWRRRMKKLDEARARARGTRR